MTRTPPDTSTSMDALAHALGLLENAQRHLRNRIASDTGINITDLTVIGIVHDLGRVTPKLLATELSMTTGAVTAVIDRIVKAGHIERTPNPRDRRSVFLELTTTGTSTAERIQDSYRAAAQAALHASPTLGTETTAEELALAAIAITAHTMDPATVRPNVKAA